jgi:glycerol-3-phosphate dehydrogenase (NAD(P)+)
MTHEIRRISVIGAGAWGTALAQTFAAAGRDTVIYARDKALVGQINDTHENGKYLAGIPLSAALGATDDLGRAVHHAEIVVLATPAQHFAALLAELAPQLPEGAVLVNTAKGIDIQSGRLLSQIAAEAAPRHPFAVLSGPTFAHEVARGLPAALTLAAPDHAHAASWARAVSSQTFRPYLSDDVTGVEVAGALKNVIAIACGIVAGKKLGENARAAVMTRGMAEIKRLGLSMGAQEQTFLGLAGIGDLTLTCHSMSSRNFSLGFEIGEGAKLADILKRRHTVAEGVATTKAAHVLAQARGIAMPIMGAVYALLYLDADVNEVIHGLLARELKFEQE